MVVAAASVNVGFSVGGGDEPEGRDCCWGGGDETRGVGLVVVGGALFNIALKRSASSAGLGAEFGEELLAMG